MGMNKLYTARANERRTEEFRRIFAATGAGVGSVIAIAFASQYKELSRLWVVVLFLSVSGALIVERCIARRMFLNLRRTGRINRRVVIVGTDAHAIGLLHTRPAQRRSRLSRRRFRRRRRSRRARWRLGARHVRRSRADHRRHQLGRRHDLAVVGDGHARQHDDSPPHRWRVPRRTVVEPPRHRRHPDPPPAPRRPHAHLRRADHPQRMASRGQAGVRHRDRDRGADRHHPGRRHRRDRQPADVARSGLLPSDPRRSRRPGVRDHQAAHDGGRRRGPQGRADGTRTRAMARCSRSATTRGSPRSVGTCASSRSTSSHSSGTCSVAR